jgi:hypothetical protein
MRTVVEVTRAAPIATGVQPLALPQPVEESFVDPLGDARQPEFG